MGLDKRVCLVLGGAGDIGAAICKRLAESDATVILAGRSEEKVQAAVDELAAADIAVHSAIVDVTDVASCKNAISEIVSKYGKLDVLVNSAGISDIAPVLLGKIANWKSVLETNTLGAFIASQAALRPMISKRYGRIIHIGSISAEVGAPYNAIYAASKAGVAGLVRSLALEVAGLGITVNGVQPGYVRTKLFHQTQGARAKLKGVTLEKHEQSLVDDTPTGTLVSLEDVASLVEYLAREESQSITGQLLNVDGGRTAR